MRVSSHYGLAALSPRQGYPDFRSGSTLACIPCDFLLCEPVGRELGLFLAADGQSWQRVYTQSTIAASRELVSKVIAPELKAVSTFTASERTRLRSDGLVQVADFTCHAVSDAVVQDLVGCAGSPYSALAEWVAEHAGLLSTAGGLVYCALQEYEIAHLDERSTDKGGLAGLRQYLRLAQAHT